MNNEILIDKYAKEDLILKKEGIIFIGIDLFAPSLRLVPRHRTIFVRKTHIAKYEDYIYIPRDKGPEKEFGYKYPSPLDSRLLPKWKWKEIKEKYSFESNERGM